MPASSSEKPRLSRNMHLLYVAYTFTAFLASGTYLGVYLYAYSYDPWLTPRWTHYMIAWWYAGRPLLSLLVLLVLVGVFIILASPDLRQCRGIWCAIVAVITVVLCCGIP